MGYMSPELVQCSDCITSAEVKSNTQSDKCTIEKKSDSYGGRFME